MKVKIQQISRSIKAYPALFFLILICVVFMFAEIVNQRFWMSDFEVYYKAAYRILHSQNLYRIEADKHYIFKYSPTSAIYFIPFLIFPFEAAKIVYWLLLTGVIVSGFYMCVEIIRPSYLKSALKRPVNLVFLFAILILAVHFLRELHLGQVNYLLLYCYISALYFYQHKENIPFSLILALSIFIKPFTLIFLPFLIYKKKYSRLVLFAFFSLVLFLLPILFYRSIDLTIDQYKNWTNELRVELSHKQGLLEDANHTFFSVFARYTPVRFLISDRSSTFMYQLIMLAALALSFLWFTRIRIKNASIEQMNYFALIEFSLLVAFIPLIAFTSENAFVFTQLLVFTILLYFNSLKNVEKGIAVVAFLFIGGNFSELTGKHLSQEIDNLSLITVGTVMLICLLFVLRKRGSLMDAITEK
ncbi:hypothetical protein BH11BAC2_BH11BAC2_25590 [soil metagenome]